LAEQCFGPLIRSWDALRYLLEFVHHGSIEIVLDWRIMTTKTTASKSVSANAGVRERIGKKGGLVACVAIVLFGVAVWTVLQQLHSGVPDQTTAYYTVDDGKTWFSDSATKFPPFDSGGRQAVQAHVFDCDGDRFVGYLSRYTADAKAVLEKNRELEKQDPNHPPATLGAAFAALNAIEYKKPGDAVWSRTMPALTRKCKNGSTPSEYMPWGIVNGVAPE
jgi:hypothetical protein